MRTCRQGTSFARFLLAKAATSRLLTLVAAAVVALAPSPGMLEAALFNWLGPGGTQSNPTSGNWNVASNWAGGLPPTNDPSTALDFGGSSGTPYISTHNLGLMQVSGLSFNSSAPVTETINASVGSSLRMVGDIFAGPMITQNGTGAFVINVPMEIAANLVYTSGFGIAVGGSITLGGNLTGTSSLTTNSTTSTLILSGNNSAYSGNIIVAPGSGTGVLSPNMSVLSARSPNALGTGNLNLLNSAGITSTNPAFATAVLEIGADLDGDAGNGWDFTRALGTGAGQVNLSGSNNRAILGFAAVGGNRSVNIGGNATPIELVQKTALLPNGGGDGWAFGSPTSDSTLVMINPLAGPDNANRNLRTIRGVGNVPEGMLRGSYRNNNRVDINGTGGLILDNVGPEAWRQGMNAGANIVRHISGGLYLAVDDPANGANSPIGRSNTTLIIGENNNGAGSAIPLGSINTGLMTYGPGTSGSSPTPIITIARALTIGTAGTGIMSIGGFTADHTRFSGNINLNTVATRFTARTGGRVEFSGVVSGGGALTIGDTVIEGDATTPGINVQGRGTVVLSGSNTYTDGTTVTHGTLLVNNTAGSGTGTGTVAIQSGAILGGSGTIMPSSAVTIASGGILAPHTTATGTSALTIAGNGLTLLNGALLNFNFGAPGVSDVINLTGTANNLTLNGSITLNIGNQPGFGFGTYPLFNFAGGSVLGGGGVVVGTNPGPQFTYNIVNQAGQMLLDVVSSAALKTWTGSVNSNWDTTTANWSPSNFANGNQVEFTNTANPASSNINIVAPISPTLISVDNSTIPTYTFGGAAIQGTASIIKENTGTLVLSGANTYTGATAVNGGTLRIVNTSGSATGSGTVSVNTGATLAGSGTVSPAGANTVIVQPGGHIAPHLTPTGTNTLTIGSNGLTLNGGTQLDFNFAAPGTGDSVELTGANNVLNIAGDVALNFNQQAGFNTGTYKLFGFGSRTGLGRININGAVPTHLLRIAESPTRIDLVAALIQTWNGAQNSIWNAGGAANWTPGGTWSNGSAARFDDMYTGPNRNITVVGAVSTDGIVAANSTGNYSIGGAGIAGPGGVQKSGTGVFTLTGANTFTGSTKVTGGVLAINSDSSLGAPPAAFVADHLTIDGGTLRALASASLSNNRGITTGAGNIIIDVANAGDALNVNSTIVGAGRLTNTGPGKLQLGDAGNSFAGLTISGGTVEAVGEGPVPQSINIGSNAATSSIIGAAVNAPLIIDGGTLKLTTKGAGGNLTIGRTITFGPAGGTLDLRNTEGGTLGGGVVNGIGGGGGLMNVDLTNTVGLVVVRWNGGQSGLSTNDPANGDWAEGSNNLQWNSVTVGAQAPPLRIELSHAGMTTIRAEQFGTYNGAFTIRGGVGGDIGAAGNQVTEIGRVQLSGTGTDFTLTSGLFLEDSVQFNLSGNVRVFNNDITLRGVASGHPANVTFHGRSTGTALAAPQAFPLRLGETGINNSRTLTIEKGATASMDTRVRTDNANSNGVEITAKTNILAGGRVRAVQSWAFGVAGNPPTFTTDHPVGYVDFHGDIVGNGTVADGDSTIEIELPFKDETLPLDNLGGVTFRTAGVDGSNLIVNGDNSGSGAGLTLRAMARSTRLHTADNQIITTPTPAFPTDPVSNVTKLSGNPGSVASASRLAALTGSGGYLTIAANGETFPFPAGGEWANGVAVGLKVINSNPGGDDVSLSTSFVHNINVDQGATLNAGGVTIGPAGPAAGSLIKGLGTINGNPTFGNGAVVAPGFGVGTLATAGTTTINGTLQAEINGQNRDQLNSYGNLVLGPTSALILPPGNAYDGATTLIIAAYTGTRTGTFASTNALPPSYTLNYGTGSNSFITLRPANPLNEWFQTGGSTWHTASNWLTNTVPNSNAETARLWSALMNDGTVDIGGTNTTVKALSFRNGFASYNVAGSTGRLTLASNAGNSSIAYESGNLKDHSISAGLTLGSNLDITLGAGRTLLLTGQQDWGGRSVTLNSGTLRYASSAAASNTAGASLTIAGGSTVELAGTASATSDGSNHVNVNNNGTLSITSGAQAIGSLSGTGNTAVATAATLTAGQIRQSSLDIAANSKVTTRPGSATSVLGALSLAVTNVPSATFDVTNSALVLDYPAAGPNPAFDTRQQIIVGRGGTGLGKPWNGAGITSSTAQADVAASPNSRSIGYAVNADLPLGALATFRGQAVDPSSVLIRYTRTADANLDGVVNDDDVTVVGTFYAPGVSKPEWAKGDFDYNGFVDDDDVTLLGVFYNPSATPIPAPATGDASGANAVAAVPEPATLVLLGMTAIALGAVAAVRRRTMR